MGRPAATCAGQAFGAERAGPFCERRLGAGSGERQIPTLSMMSSLMLASCICAIADLRR
jgi:hypothetical protein